MVENLNELNELNEFSINQIKFTVSELNQKFAEHIKNDSTFSNISIHGEISNFTNHHKTGHLYFTLKDEKASIGAVMFKWSAKDLSFTPENGMKVTAVGDASVYEPRGHCQLRINSMQPEGLGALYIQFLQLRQKLESEGLFLQKRTLPKNPSKIAVITAETGAALQDILNILGRRNPLVKVLLFPALVQGVNAPNSLIFALSNAQSSDADVIILGRGGGSLEDLWAFNDEAFARSIYASKIPTISAVGHEIDFTIADFVADLRAPTPSAAAELSVSDVNEIYDNLNVLEQNLHSNLIRNLEGKFERVNAFSREIEAKSPLGRLATYETQLETLQNQVETTINTTISSKRQRLIAQMKQIDALSPLKVLTRGYSIVTSVDNKPIINATDVEVGSRISVKLHKGKITAEVKERHG